MRSLSELGDISCRGEQIDRNIWFDDILVYENRKWSVYGFHETREGMLLGWDTSFRTIRVHPLGKFK